MMIYWSRIPAKKEIKMVKWYRSKKVATGLIVTLIVLAMMSSHLVLASSTVVSISNASADPYDTTTVPISITDVTDLGAATIWLSYDKDVVEVDSVGVGDLGSITYGINNADGITKMSWASATGYTGTYVFAYITLHAVGSVCETSPLDLDVRELADTSANPIVHAVADGEFQVTGTMLCTSPDPPAHDFGTVPEGEERSWSFDIINCCTGTLTWDVTDDQPWITVTPASGSTTTETDTVTVDIDTTGLECGITHTGTITVTSNDGTKNGTITVHVPCGVLPDLVITDKSENWQDGKFTVSYKVYNAGEGDAAASEAMLFIDDNDVEHQDTPTLALGESTEEMTFTTEIDYPCGGIVTIKVCADNWNVVDESDETNNCEINIVEPAAGVCCPDPDVSISDQGVTDDPASDPDTYDPTNMPPDVTYENAKGFHLEATGSDGSYEFFVTFETPVENGFTLYKLPSWTEVAYTLVGPNTIRVELNIIGGVLDPAFILAGSASSACFIATAAYGTAMAEEIQILREFRDGYLLTNPLGKGLVDFYYKVSPPIAEFITEHPSLKPIVRAGLLPAVATSTVAVNTAPVEKAAIAGLLALISVALVVWATRWRGRDPEHT
jgi:hypothetical protein